MVALRVPSLTDGVNGWGEAVGPPRLGAPVVDFYKPLGRLGPAPSKAYIAGNRAFAMGEQVPFLPGQSGNPSGRRPGTRTKKQLIVEQIFEADAEKVGRKAVALALAGNTDCIRLIIDRVAPAPRGRRVRFALPQVSSADPVALIAVVNCILKAASEAEISIDEAASLANTVESGVRIVEFAELAERVAALEAHCREPAFGTGR